MHQGTVRALRYAVLAAGVAVLGVGSAAAAQGAEPDTPKPPALGNPATVCNNDVVAGPVLLEHPCVDGSQDPLVDVEEGSVPAP